MKNFYAVFFLISHLLCAQDFAAGDRDPLAHINYPEAFNLLKTQEKFKRILSELGCGNNIFSDERDNYPEKNKEKTEYFLIDMSMINNDGDIENLKQQFKAYQEVCWAFK